MSIVMPAMHLSPFDPFNSSYNTTYFDSQDHYLQPAVAYSSPHQFPVDPRWFNSSFSGHASAAPHYFSMTHSDIISPPSPTDLLSLSPSSTIAPIPPLSRSRNRQSSMSNANTNNRIRSFTRPATRYQRQSSASHVSSTVSNTTSSNNDNNTTTTPSSSATTNTTTTQRIARRSTVSTSSPSSSRLLASPNLNNPFSSYSTQSPTLRHSPPLGFDSSRATKRRRTDDLDASHLQSFTTVPEPPQLLTTTQTPHLALMHAHGYPSAQTWAGPPSAGADHLPHGVSPDPHSYSQWPVLPLPYYPTDTSESQLHDVSLPSSDVSQPQMLPYLSPTVAGPTFFSSALSPEMETPRSAVSVQFHVPKFESQSPQLVQAILDEEQGETVEHGPTDFPPRAYPGGQDGKSPWTPVKTVGKIYGSRLEQMPAIEARMARLENQIDQYLDVRAAQALKNSQLPGLDFDQPSIEFKPMSPCRMYGGQIWPTALARRVRRTPRD